MAQDITRLSDYELSLQLEAARNLGEEVLAPLTAEQERRRQLKAAPGANIAVRVLVFIFAYVAITKTLAYGFGVSPVFQLVFGLGGGAGASTVVNNLIKARKLKAASVAP